MTTSEGNLTRTMPFYGILFFVVNSKVYLTGVVNATVELGVALFGSLIVPIVGSKVS
jgi:hypothetical protein